jgi:type II secretory pathway component PulJ
MHPQRGETLVGLLVGLALGLLVAAAGQRMLAQQLRHERQTQTLLQAQTQLRDAIDLMLHSLQGAQGIPRAWNTRIDAQCHDAFCNGTEDFSLSGNQLEFTLDRNRDGVQDNNECLGFRLTAGEIKAKTSCTPVVWTSLTGSDHLRVTALTWQLRCTIHGHMVKRWMDLEVTAQWPGELAQSFVQQQSVLLHNDVPVRSMAGLCGIAPA